MWKKKENERERSKLRRISLFRKRRAHAGVVWESAEWNSAIFNENLGLNYKEENTERSSDIHIDGAAEMFCFHSVLTWVNRIFRRENLKTRESRHKMLFRWIRALEWRSPVSSADNTHCTLHLSRSSCLRDFIVELSWFSRGLKKFSHLLFFEKSDPKYYHQHRRKLRLNWTWKTFSILPKKM